MYNIEISYNGRQTAQTLELFYTECCIGVITFEHDYYVDTSKQIRNKSRNLLESHGYKLVVQNVSPDDNSPFEDWWVHPHIISEEQIKKVEASKQDILNIKNYFYNE